MYHQHLLPINTGHLELLFSIRSLPFPKWGLARALCQSKGSPFHKGQFMGDLGTLIFSHWNNSSSMSDSPGPFIRYRLGVARLAIWCEKSTVKILQNPRRSHTNRETLRITSSKRTIDAIWPTYDISPTQIALNCGIALAIRHILGA